MAWDLPRWAPEVQRERLWRQRVAPFWRPASLVLRHAPAADRRSVARVLAAHLASQYAEGYEDRLVLLIFRLVMRQTALAPAASTAENAAFSRSKLRGRFASPF